MTAATRTESLLQAYRSRTGELPTLSCGGPAVHEPEWDDVSGPAGELRPGWDDLGDALDRIGRDGLPGLSRLVDRLLEDDGVTYTPVRPASSERLSLPMGWLLDPVPIVVDGSDWADLEAGLVQRATLLDLVLTDLYGDRALIRRGLIPPELVFRHDYYLRAAHGITIPGAHQLFFHAVDLARRPDGTFVALADRAQAPSGSAYAMASRRVITKVLPEVYRSVGPRALTTFFHTVRGALQGIAPVGVDDPRVVVLSPGSYSETAFDQAFLASLLGLPLVESADLTVRGGRLWMRALGGFEPVDVVLRRVDADFADPLDLRRDSKLGVVGLLEAARRSSVTVVNSLGSGVVDNPGLLPYLPALARDLLDEELLIDSVPTYWCGDSEARNYVRDHLADLVLRPTGGGADVLPWCLDSAGRQQLWATIEENPAVWVGQRRPMFGQAPTVANDQLVARHVGFRSFAVAHQSGYVVMPGGLGRIVRDDLLPGGTGDPRQGPRPAAAKDVWVLSQRADGQPPAHLRRMEDSVRLVSPVALGAAASPRVLEDLHWLGRYAERTEFMTRLLESARDLVDTYRYRRGDPRVASVGVLLDAVSAVSTTDISFSPDEHPRGDLRRMLLDSGQPGTVAQALSGLSETARSVRDQLSGDTWMVLAGVDRALAELAARPADTGSRLQATHAAVISGMLALSGLAAENMVRDPGWYLMDIGRRIERAQQLSALLLATLARAQPPEVEATVIDAVLAVAESGVTYRRRYRGHLQVVTVLDLLVIDQGNPRSLAYQVGAIATGLRTLPDASGTSRPERLTDELAALLRRASLENMDDLDDKGERGDLAAFLTDVHQALRGLADAITTQHFFRSRPMLPLGPLGPLPDE